MPRFACPACDAALRVADEDAGRKAPCPHCGQRILIPGVDRSKTKLGKLLPERDRDEEDVFQEVPRRRRALVRSGFHCPFCDSDEVPIKKSRISQAGWVLFVVLLLFCLPLCFLGLLVSEEYRVCADCGSNLG